MVVRVECCSRYSFLSRSNYKPTTPITTLSFVGTLLLSGLSRHPLRISEGSGVVISFTENFLHGILNPTTGEEKLFISLTCQWLTTSLTIGETPYRTHWPSNSLIHVSYIAHHSSLLIISLHMDRLHATIVVSADDLACSGTTQSHASQAISTIGRYLPLESTYQPVIVQQYPGWVRVFPKILTTEFHNNS